MPRKNSRKQKPVVVEGELSQGAAVRQEERVQVALNNPFLVRRSRRTQRTSDAKQKSLTEASFTDVRNELDRRSRELGYICLCKKFSAADSGKSEEVDKRERFVMHLDADTQAKLRESVAAFEEANAR
jgi:hypothetical protein